MALIYIGMLDEFAEGDRRFVEVQGRSIAVFHLAGQLYAVLNYCPHQGARLCEGPVTSWIRSSRPGEFEYEREDEIVRCPWHGWEFDIKTGCLMVDTKIRTRTYDIRVETFDLSVQQDKVYIEI